MDFQKPPQAYRVSVADDDQIKMVATAQPHKDGVPLKRSMPSVLEFNPDEDCPICKAKKDGTKVPHRPHDPRCPRNPAKKPDSAKVDKGPAEEEAPPAEEVPRKRQKKKVKFDSSDPHKSISKLVAKEIEAQKKTEKAKVNDEQ